MPDITIAVLGDPAEPALGRLDSLGSDVRIGIGKTAEALSPYLADAQVLFNWLGNQEEVRRAMQLAPKLEWIHARYAGLDRLLFPELVGSPVPFSNGSGVFSQSLGEFAILGRALLRKSNVPRLLRVESRARVGGLRCCRDRESRPWASVGHGDIGRAVAWRAKALGMRVLALRRDTAPRPGDEHVDRVFAPAELPSMLRESDYVVVSAPLTPETKGMIGKAEFAVMKSEAIIMNVGRGPVVDEPAMIEALRSGRIHGAALDVFEVEPLPQESPLWAMENVLISPHTADHTADWHEDAARFFIEQFERWKRGEPLKNVVDKKAGY